MSRFHAAVLSLFIFSGTSIPGFAERVETASPPASAHEPLSQTEVIYRTHMCLLTKPAAVCGEQSMLSRDAFAKEAAFIGKLQRGKKSGVKTKLASKHMDCVEEKCRRYLVEGDGSLDPTGRLAYEQCVNDCFK